MENRREKPISAVETKNLPDTSYTIGVSYDRDTCTMGDGE